MRGSLKQRSKGSWSLILDLGREIDPITGKTKRKQRWITFRGTKKEAGDKLTELVGAANGGTFVEPSKATLIEWLRTWVEKSVKPPMRRPETYRVYRSFIEKHVAPSALANVPLQRLRGSDLERFYAERKMAKSSLKVLHAVIHRALKRAVKDRVLTVNPAVDLDRQKPDDDRSRSAREHCWSADEARRFIAAAKRTSAQLAAFSVLALDSGARKSELHGLLWTDIDLDAGTVIFQRQLDRAGAEPTFGVTKTGRARTVSIGPDTVARLRAHRKAQAALKMKNRTTYRDFGLVFAKEHEDCVARGAQLGQPLKTLSEARFVRLVKSAGVKPIKFHGLRHTCATLSLAVGVPVHVVSQRLGHAKASMTLDVYSHALPSLQQDAATRLAAVLHG